MSTPPVHPPPNSSPPGPPGPQPPPPPTPADEPASILPPVEPVLSPVAVTPDQTTQQQIDLLKAEITELNTRLQAQKASRGVPVWWTKLSAWAASKGGWMHALAGLYAALAIFIEANPQAHALFVQVWAEMPKKLIDALMLVAPLVTWYVGSLKSAPTVQAE